MPKAIFNVHVDFCDTCTIDSLAKLLYNNLENLDVIIIKHSYQLLYFIITTHFSCRFRLIVQTTTTIPTSTTRTTTL